MLMYKLLYTDSFYGERFSIETDLAVAAINVMRALQKDPARFSDFELRNKYDELYGQAEAKAEEGSEG